MTTSSPVSRRMPAPSEPGTNGIGNAYCGPGGLQTSRSRRLTAAVRSPTTPSPPPASGSSKSSYSSLPMSLTTIAFTERTYLPERGPGVFGRHVDRDVAAVADRRGEHDLQLDR